MISSSQSASVNNIESSVVSSPSFDSIKVEIDKKSTINLYWFLVDFLECDIKI